MTCWMKSIFKTRSYVSLLLASLLLHACSKPDDKIALEFKPMQGIDFAAWETIKVIDKAVGQQLTLVDFWATWCDSCMQEFPKIVGLHNKYREKGVRVVSLNLDEWAHKSTVAKANDFLASTSATFEHYQLQENMLKAFDYFDLLGIPAIMLLDKDGNELTRFTGDDPENQYTIEMIEAAIAKNLGV